MKHRVAIVLLVLSGLLVAHAVHADEIRLKNGDRFNGALQRLDATEATVNTSFSGELTVPREKILTISTTKPVTVVLEENRYLTGRLVVDTGARMSLSSEEGMFRQGDPFRLEDVKSIYRVDPREVVRQRLDVKLSGHLNVGVDVSEGNTEEEKYDLNGQLQARTPRNRYTVTAQYHQAESDGTQTAKNAQGSLKYDHFLGEKWFLYNTLSLEKDEFKNLNLRTSVGAGIGYQAYESEELSLYIEAGPAYINEDFVSTPDESSFGGGYAINYEHKWREWVRFFHGQEGLYGQDTDFIFRSRTGARIPLGAGFQSTVQFNLDWDGDPPAGTENTDRRYLFLLGYTF